jgi:hypothetical protein
MRRLGTSRRWVGGILVALTAGVLLFLVGCCCSRPVASPGAPHRYPPVAALALPTPEAVEAAADSVTEITMRNVDFHLDDEIRMGISRLRGRMRDLSGGEVVILDDKRKLLLEIEDAEIGLSSRNLTLLLNRYVFGYPGSPLHDLTVRTEGSQIVQTGTMHKVIDIPFEMTATLSVTDSGDIRIHPTVMKICGLDGKGLLRAVNLKLEDLLDLSGGKGVRVEGNDLILDPLAILPPPRISGRLTGIRVQGDRIVQLFGGADGPEPEPLTPSVPAPNFVYFHGGSLRFGKLYMVQTDLEAIDTDESDPFDFYLDYYHSQLVSGYHVTSKDYGLVAYMPDFDDLGTTKGRPSQPPPDR